MNDVSVDAAVIRAFDLNRNSSVTVSYLAPKLGLPSDKVYDACRRLSDGKELLFLRSGSDPYSACYAHPEFHRPTDPAGDDFVSAVVVG